MSSVVRLVAPVFDLSRYNDELHEETFAPDLGNLPYTTKKISKVIGFTNSAFQDVAMGFRSQTFQHVIPVSWATIVDL